MKPQSLLLAIIFSVSTLAFSTLLKDTYLYRAFPITSLYPGVQW